MTFESHQQEGRLAPGSGPLRQRDTRYLDFAIQMRMLIALVGMEIILVGGAVYYLYERFSTILEENIYRIHQLPLDLSSVMVNEIIKVAGGMILLNLVALFVADRIWSKYVARILQAFTNMALHVSDLDFHPDADPPSSQHELLDLMLAWRQQERQRLVKIREEIQKLDPNADFSDPRVLAGIQEQVRQLRHILPPYSRRFVGRVKDLDPG
ncbi:MAG: hypothetical protein H7833_13770 [Magnetococcus sp. DMHC-1]|nr:hypothetical protein [Magnetococcales bacterium]